METRGSDLMFLVGCTRADCIGKSVRPQGKSRSVNKDISLVPFLPLTDLSRRLCSVHGTRDRWSGRTDPLISGRVTKLTTPLEGGGRDEFFF